jgi:hypothetical protein
MELYNLHKELVDSGKMTNRQFHDAVLKENRIPIEMIRASLENQPLTRDYKTAWRFPSTSRLRRKLSAPSCGGIATVKVERIEPEIETI